MKMNKQQKTDLIFLIFSLAPALLLTLFVLMNMLQINLFINNFFGEAWPIVFVSSVVLGLFDLVFFLKHYSKNKPMQYEKEKKYTYYALCLGFYNLALPAFVFYWILVGFAALVKNGG
jgi:hypothetical protein